jgi:hypothetical protein
MALLLSIGSVGPWNDWNMVVDGIMDVAIATAWVRWLGRL